MKNCSGSINSQLPGTQVSQMDPTLRSSIFSITKTSSRDYCRRLDLPFPLFLNDRPYLMLTDLPPSLREVRLLPALDEHPCRLGYFQIFPGSPPTREKVHVRRGFGFINHYSVIHLCVLDIVCVLFWTQSACMVAKQYTQNFYHKQMDNGVSNFQCSVTNHL